MTKMKTTGLMSADVTLAGYLRLRRSTRYALPQFLKAYPDLPRLSGGDGAEGFFLRWGHDLRRMKHQSPGLWIKLFEGLESDG